MKKLVASTAAASLLALASQGGYEERLVVYLRQTAASLKEIHPAQRSPQGSA